MSTLTNFINSISQSLGFWYLIILNAFGVFAIIFKVSESQFKKRSLIIFFAGVSTGCWMIYYLLNDNLTSSLTSLIAIIKYIIFAQREKHKWANNIFWLYLFIIIQLVVCVLTYKNYTSLFATAAGALGTFAYFTVSQKKYRWTLLCCQSCWVLNGALNLYLIPLVADSLVTISIITAIVRFHIAEKKQKEKLAKESIQINQNN